MRSVPDIAAISLNDAPHASNEHFPPLRRALDRLAAMAIQLTDARGAVLLVPAENSVTFKGAAGLSPIEQGSFMAWAGPAGLHLEASDQPVCITRTESPALAIVTAGTEPVRRTDWLALPPTGARPHGWLVLLDARPAQETSPLTADTLSLVLEQAAALLDLDQGQPSPNALHESESRLNLTEHTAGVGSWSVVLATGRVHISNECALILGVDDALQIDSLEAMVNCYTPEWRDGMRKRLLRCEQTGVAFDEEIQVMVDGVGPKWVRTVGAALRDAEGHIVRLQGAVQDISAQKQAQQETLRLAMRLTTTLASITEAFVTLDRECRFTYLNQESERLLQKSTADLLDKEIWDGFGPGLSERLRDQMHKALK
ncbi:MAG TPA: PAS domain-containing protein, partial [Hydrogenophaga sp.]|nr:PAS domain-containing protein [Hydrogenophaga sp.]